MRERQRKIVENQQGSFRFKDGEVGNNLARSLRNLEKLRKKRAEKSASSGTMSFSTGK